MTLTRFKEKSMILLLKKVTYLRSVLAHESKQIWLLDKEQVLQNLIPPSDTDMQPFQITDAQTALDPGLDGH